MVLSKEKRKVDDSIDNTTNHHRGPLTFRGAFAGSTTGSNDFSTEFESGNEGVPGRSGEGAELDWCACFSDSPETGFSVEAIAARDESSSADRYGECKKMTMRREYQRPDR